MGWHKKDKQKFIRPSIILVSSFLLIGFMVFGKTARVGAESPVHPAFKDNSFYKCVIDNLNKEKVSDKTNRNYNYKVSDDELLGLKKLECESSKLSEPNQKVESINMAGLEKLTSLTDLKLHVPGFIPLSNFDLTKLTKLENLDIASAKNKLDLSKNLKLEKLRVFVDVFSDRTIPPIVFPRGDTLRTVKLYLLSRLEQPLDFSGLLGLEDLRMADMFGQLHTNLSNNTKLKRLHLTGFIADDKVFDLSNNINLEEFTYTGTSKIVSDFSKNIRLKKVTINNTTAVQGGTTQGLGKCFSLQTQGGSDFFGKYGLLDFSNNQELESLSLYNIVIDDLVLGKNNALKTLEIDSVFLKSLDLSSSTQLKKINLKCNNLNKIDLSRNRELDEVEIVHNALEQINFSNNEAITKLNLYDNHLKDIGINRLSQLKELNLSDNQFTFLDISNYPIESLAVSNNRLTEVKTSKNGLYRYSLRGLDLANNQLTTIDLSDYENLESLHLSNNQLTSLDLNKNSNLKNLGLSNNQLDALDISKNTALKYLFLSKNKLSEINLLNNLELEELKLSDNYFFQKLDISKNIKLNFKDLELDNNSTKLKVPTKTAKDILANKYSNLIIEVAEGGDTAKKIKTTIAHDDETEAINNKGSAILLLALVIFRVIPSIIALVIIFLKKRKLKKARKLIN